MTPDTTPQEPEDVNTFVPTESPGQIRVREERERQIGKEAWTPEGDDMYTTGQLNRAAVAYLLGDATMWPIDWLPEFWKPKTRTRDLERAGALFLAEADRLGRYYDRLTDAEQDDDNGCLAYMSGVEARGRANFCADLLDMIISGKYAPQLIQF